MEEQSQAIGMTATFERLLDRQVAVLFDIHHKITERKARSGEIQAVFRFGGGIFALPNSMRGTFTEANPSA